MLWHDLFDRKKKHLNIKKPIIKIERNIKIKENKIREKIIAKKTTQKIPKEQKSQSIIENYYKKPLCKSIIIPLKKHLPSLIFLLSTNTEYLYQIEPASATVIAQNTKRRFFNFDRIFIKVIQFLYAIFSSCLSSFIISSLASNCNLHNNSFIIYFSIKTFDFITRDRERKFFFNR